MMKVFKSALAVSYFYLRWVVFFRPVNLGGDCNRKNFS